MSLSAKIALILAAVLGGFAVIGGLVQDRIFFDRFVEVEEREARKDLARIGKALDEELQDLDRTARGLAESDLTLRFLDGGAAALEASEFTPRRLRLQEIDLLFLVAPGDASTARVVFSHLRDRDTDADVQMREFPTEAWSRSHPLLLAAEGGASIGLQQMGVQLTGRGPILLATHELRGSAGAGPALGTLVVGRFVSAALDDALTALTEVDFDFWQVDGRSALPPEVSEVLPDVTSSASAVLRESGAELHVYGTFDDIRRRPELLLRVKVPRDITGTGAVALRFGQTSTLIAGGLTLLVLMALLKRIVLGPLTTLTRHALRIGTEEDFRAKLELRRGDEIGTLAGEFDQMMEKLEHARAALVDTARMAGMSEIATGILHNVGNVLNSVNISAAMVAQKVDTLSVTDLQKLVDVLDEHAGDLVAFVRDDPKGRHLHPFLSALTAQLGDERERLASEIGSLTDGIDHICELIKSQQEFAVQADLVEPLDLAARVDEALAITEKAAGLDPSVEIVREYQDMPEVLADKHRLLEILVNLLQNARQALRSCDATPKRLTLRVGRTERSAFIEVADTGLGISAEDLSKVFHLGFTTKPSGHGYGLHTAANAATEMGGKLTARSDGPGKGATFTLEMPLRASTPAPLTR
jgi:signal transduction histidine kinase